MWPFYKSREEREREEKLSELGFIGDSSDYLWFEQLKGMNMMLQSAAEQKQIAQNPTSTDLSDAQMDDLAERIAAKLRKGKVKR